MNTKLGAKISARMFRRDRDVLQMRRRGHVRLKTRIEFTHAFQENRIRSSFAKPEGRCLCKQLSWIVFAVSPDPAMEIREDTGAVSGPAPPVVPGQTLE